MRKAILSFLLAAGVAAAANAADYVVVSSTDPGLKPGLELEGGQALALAPGQTARLISATGEVTLLRGGPSGATAPARGAPANGSRLALLKVLLDPPPVTRILGASRGGVCPDPATLTTVDAILMVQSGGCDEAAKAALVAYAANAR